MAKIPFFIFLKKIRQIAKFRKSKKKKKKTLVQRSESCFRVCLPDEVVHSALKAKERERQRARCSRLSEQFGITAETR
jgi:hypothetical protein